VAEVLAKARTSDEVAVLEGLPAGLLIGSDWRPARDGGTFAVEDPATGETLAHVADATPGDGMAALDAAFEAREAWAATAPRERSDILRRAFDAVLDRRDELALLMTLEMGKPLAEAQGEVTYGAEFLRWFSEEAVRIDGRLTRAPGGDAELLVTRQPVGPCLLITPWNFPLAMATRKVGPAVAAGCTIVLKPAEQTPLTSLAFAAIMLEAGLPAGVLNVITTADAAPVVGPLMDDPRLRKVSFTGSTAVGRVLVRQSATNLMRTSMELGGNAPFIVFEDADVDAAIDGAMLAKMRNGGEACTAANRFYVHESVADRFAHGLAERMGALTVGRGTEDGVDLGPLIDDAQRSKVAELVADARARGAEVLTGGEPLDGPGYFYPPTVLAGTPADAALLREEIFGPVAPIVRFGDDDEAIAAANDTEYGLIAYVYTGDLARGLRVMNRLETGMVALNRGIVSNAAAPFGGVKASGLGREGGPEGIGEYLETRYAAFSLDDGPASR
jgi:succinate-semialdehyde dehydrogenase/glutarate-semialdehyde dehydrogenase